MDPLFIAEIIGTIAFAVSGFYVAAKDRLDLLGVFISAFLTALGGGLTRDAIAGRAPYTFTHILPGILVVGVILFAVLFKLHKHDKVEQRFFFIISDTLGLVSFSVTGSLVALQSGFNFFGVIMLGLTTAVGGGVMRDILLNKVPLLLSTGLYGTVALVVGTLIYGLEVVNLLNPASILICSLVGIVLRLGAYWKGWNLPILK
ncbi:MAG: trimeric intracellular cation channel family protein [Campylobacteraceae bacterium]|nr:trimeric intracellular cation channel family protein [Campylobacteraceae bacterium]